MCHNSSTATKVERWAFRFQAGGHRFENALYKTMFLSGDFRTSSCRFRESDSGLGAKVWVSGFGFDAKRDRVHLISLGFGVRVAGFGV